MRVGAAAGRGPSPLVPKSTKASEVAAVAITTSSAIDFRPATLRRAGRGPSPLIVKPVYGTLVPAIFSPALITPTYMNTNLFRDGRGIGQITPHDFQTMVNALAGVPTSIINQSYVPVIADYGTLIEIDSASPVTYTIPPNVFGVFTVLYISQYGSGQITLVSGPGVTLRTPSTLTTRSQFSTIIARQRALNEWVISGDMT